MDYVTYSSDLRQHSISKHINISIKSKFIMWDKDCIISGHGFFYLRPIPNLHFLQSFRSLALQMSYYRIEVVHF